MTFYTATVFFDKLSPSHLYDVLKLRQDVFILEQKCFYRDLDDTDKICHHVMIYDNNKLQACCRIVPPGVKYKGVSLGRICSSLENRGKKYGIKLMEMALKFCEINYPKIPIEISAQTYLINYYGKFGFETFGEQYLEDNQPHIYMIKK